MSFIKWKKTADRIVFDGRVKLKEYDVVLPNGAASKYLVDSADPAVAVLIKVDGSNILLLHQYRFPLDEWIYDLPGGRVNNGENIEDAARRECAEETGYKLGQITRLGKFYPNPGRSDWAAHLFFSEDYEIIGESKTDDHSELPETEIISIADFEEKIKQQQIIDPSLLISFFLAKSQGLL